MPSRLYRWTGSCPDRAGQDRLLHYAGRLAERHARRWAAGRPASRIFTFDPPLLPVVGPGEETLSGRVLLEPELGPEPDVLLAEARRAGIPIEMEKRGPHRSARSFLRLDSVRIYGLEFTVYDLRSADRMDFKFIRDPRHAFLDGRLVQVQRGSIYSPYFSPLMAESDWCLDAPSADLRYFLERWILKFLAWLRFFVLEDLRYERYPDPRGGVLPEYDQHRTRFRAQVEEMGLPQAREASFESLLEDFEEETDDWFNSPPPNDP